jgi:chemotaxis protein MotB
MAKKKHEEHENHERWLVSYADFITLLFAFFVVMYSVSSVNEGKYRTVSESIKAALNPVASQPASRLPFNVGDTKPHIISPDLAPINEPAIRRIREMLRAVQQGAKVDIQDIRVIDNGNGSITISLPDWVLFQSGEATIRPQGIEFLKSLADVLMEMGRQVRVLGHTDNVPIRTAQFPSNWELSAARAVMVVRILSELHGVPAEHLSATGFGDSRPVADNLTPEGRAKNRRVEIVVLERDFHEPGEQEAAAAVQPALAAPSMGAPPVKNETQSTDRTMNEENGSGALASPNDSERRPPAGT